MKLAEEFSCETNLNEFEIVEVNTQIITLFFFGLKVPLLARFF